MRFLSKTLNTLGISVMLGLTLPSLAVEIGESIENTASAAFLWNDQALDVRSNSVDIIKTVQRTSAQIQTFRLNLDSDATSASSINRSCISDQNQLSVFETYSHPSAGSIDGQSSPSQEFSTADAVALSPSDSFRSGEPVFIQVVDPDQNLHTQKQETLSVTVTSPSGDEERVILTEQGLNAGTFLGVLQSTALPTSSFDCQLTAETDSQLVVDYIDPEDPTDQAQTMPLVDPFGVIYDSLSGEALSSLTVTLYEILPDGSRVPATVYADDGITPWPSQLVSGTQVSAGAFTEQFPEGGFRFPLIAPGDYILVVEGDGVTEGPSVLPFSQAGEVNGQRFSPLEDGSYELPFNVPLGPPLNVDIPKDSIKAPGLNTDLVIEKTTQQQFVGTGDFVQYEVKLSNINPLITKEQVVIYDQLPAGMRLVKKSVKQQLSRGSQPLVAEVADNGRQFSIEVGDIGSDQSITVQYVAQIISSASSKTLINRVYAQDRYEVRSNNATAKVFWVDDLQQNVNQLIGRVWLNQCLPTEAYSVQQMAAIEEPQHPMREAITDFIADYPEQSVVDAVELRLVNRLGESAQDNVIVEAIMSDIKALLPEAAVTLDFEFNAEADATGQGRYNQVHIALIGQQVEQKTWYYDSKDTARQLGAFLGDIRIFLEDGTYALTDNEGRFHFDGIDNQSHVVQLDVDSLPDGMTVVPCDQDTRFAGRAFSQFVDLSGGSLWRADFYVKMEPKAATDSALLSSGSDDSAESDQAELNPFADVAAELALLKPDQPYADLPVLDLAVSYPSHAAIAVLVNGEPVNPVYRGKVHKNRSGDAAIGTWGGVPIRAGANLIEVQQLNAQQTVVGRLEHRVYFNAKVQQVELIEEKSILSADGKTAPVIAVRFTDNAGNPAHKDLRGAFSVEAPYSAYIDDQVQLNNVLLREGIRKEYHIQENGIAYIKLEPTQVSGQVTLNFDIDGDRETIKAWLKPEARDWILVGIAEGTVGYSTIQDHAEALEKGGPEEGYYDEGRVAFYAKGRIKGEWLLTAAYDTNKRSQGEFERTLVDPTLYYTLFADASQTYQDALSSKKIYLKIERDQFYALFGDYTTGFTETELSRYERRFTGLKSEFKTDKTLVNLFAANENYYFVKDELRGQNISGPYKLRTGNIIVNSEQIRIETRRRNNQLEVLSAEILQRFIDYDIDYRDGTILFKEPINGFDENLNPVFIVAEYELNQLEEGEASFGAQIQHQLTDSVQVGLTTVNQAQEDAQGQVHGLNAKVKTGEQSSLVVEAAQSQTRDNGAAYSGLVRYDYEGDKLDSEIALRSFDNDYGLGQQNVVEDNIHQISASADYQISEQMTLRSHAQNEWGNGGQRYGDYESSLHYFNDYGAEQYGLSLGARMTHYEGADQQMNQQLLVGAYKTFMERKLRLSLQSEQALSGDATDQNRYSGSIDYQVTQATSLYYHHELQTGDAEQTLQQLGVKTRPWKNGQVSSYVSREQTRGNPYQLFSHYGLIQSLPINERVFLSVGFDRAQALNKVRFPENSLTATPVEDYTTVSLGANYKADTWTLNNQVEYRNSDTSERYGARVNWYRPQDNGYVYGFKVEGFETQEAKRQYLDQQLISELSMAYRPQSMSWSVLERFRVVYDRIRDAEDEQLGKKFINHLRTNYKPNLDNELSIGYSVKLNLQQFDHDSYDSWSHFVSSEYRHDIQPFGWQETTMDVGVQASTLISGPTTSYAFGPMVGIHLADNIWLSAGYNFDGFVDYDFADASYTSQGPWVTFRMKFDQTGLASD